MKTIMQNFGLALLVALAMGCESSINKNIYVQDGERRDSGVNTVNGSITIGSDCVIRGDCRSVNGSIRVGQNSQVRELQVVNGNIELGANSRARGDIVTVNGAITLGSGTVVTGDVQTINGGIELDHATVENDLTLYNGEIRLTNGSIVKGDIVIKDSKGKRSKEPVIRIRIEDSCVVEGDITVWEREAAVKIYLGKEARIGGEVTGAEVVREI